MTSSRRFFMCPQASCISPVGCWPTLPWWKPQSGSRFLVLKSRNRFLIGLWLWDWFGHSRTLTIIVLKTYPRYLGGVFRVICLLVLPILAELEFSANSFGLSSRILMWSSFLIISCTLMSVPVPLERKHPHNIMFPPPWLTVVTVILGLYDIPLFHQMYSASICPNDSNLFSPVHKMLDQKLGTCFRKTFSWASSEQQRLPKPVSMQTYLCLVKRFD